MVSRIIYEIDHLLENKLLSDISKKLEIIKNYLITEYGNKQIIQEKEKKIISSLHYFYRSWKKRNKWYIKSSKKKKQLSENWRTSVDFLYYLKQKGNINTHIIGKDQLKYHKSLLLDKNNNDKKYNDLDSILKNEFEVSVINENFNLDFLIDLLFKSESETLYNSKNKIDYILRKYETKFEGAITSNVEVKDKIQKFKSKINNIKERINDIILFILNYKEKWEKYENTFCLKNCYNDIVRKIRNEFNAKGDLELLLSKYEKFGYKYIQFILLYYLKLSYYNLNDNKEELLTESDKIKNEFCNNYNRIEKIILIKPALDGLKFFSFDINEMFNNFMKEYEENNSVVKKIKLDNKNIVEKFSPNLDEIIDFLKKLVGEKEIDMSDDDKRDFVFECFKFQIGYTF